MTVILAVAVTVVAWAVAVLFARDRRREAQFRVLRDDVRSLRTELRLEGRLDQMLEEVDDDSWPLAGVIPFGAAVASLRRRPGRAMALGAAIAAGLATLLLISSRDGGHGRGELAGPASTTPRSTLAEPSPGVGRPDTSPASAQLDVPDVPAAPPAPATLPPTAGVEPRGPDGGGAPEAPREGAPPPPPPTGQPAPPEPVPDGPAPDPPDPPSPPPDAEPPEDDPSPPDGPEAEVPLVALEVETGLLGVAVAVTAASGDGGLLGVCLEPAA